MLKLDYRELRYRALSNSIFMHIADLRFGFLRLSTLRKCPHMLRSDQRELRNSLVKLGWVVCGWWVVCNQTLVVSS